MLDFKRVDKLLVYCVLFGCFLLLDYNTPTQNGESYNFVKSIILAPIIEEMLYRLIFIGIVFLGIEWVSNNPNSKFKVPIGIFSVFGLFYSIAFVFIPFYEEYLEIIGIISTVLAIVLFKILLDKSIRIKLIILVIISSIDFGMIHGLERFPSTFIAGLFFAILFINRAKLEFWDDFTNRLSKIKHLLFGYLTVYFIHLYNNFIIIMFSNNLEMSWICLLILSGVALLVYGSQIIFSKVEERGI